MSGKMGYRLGDQVRITKGILKGQVGAVSACKLNCIYFIQREHSGKVEWFDAYGPFLDDEIEPA